MLLIIGRIIIMMIKTTAAAAAVGRSLIKRDTTAVELHQSVQDILIIDEGSLAGQEEALAHFDIQQMLRAVELYPKLQVYMCPGDRLRRLHLDRS